ncbi:MAG: cytochrome c family protein [Saprospiraceae bacterium]|nr:cytochrome c family protein [Saprospiraceae bacterium]
MKLRNASSNLNKFSLAGLLAVLLWVLPNLVCAQLSPGELFKGHAELEGNFNCTKCHTIGEKVSDAKCLDCHKEIQSRINQRKGYHFSQEVKSKTCIQCHSDHHGRNFQIIRFNEKQFDHKSTGFTLTGKHQNIDCKSCHKSAFVADAQLKKKSKTFLGLDSKCISCHEDVHRETMDKDCAKCHHTESFKPAVTFDHQKTKFPLNGKHKTVECKACHKDMQIANAKKLVFELKSYQTCNSCHSNPHKKSINTCNDCHTEESFSKFSGGRNFNHNKTTFPLKGKHQQTLCSKCHDLKKSPLQLFQDHQNVLTSACVNCHKDVHEGKFGENCAQCHNESGFKAQLKMDQFNHALTNFKLEGKHLQVDCKKCHISSYTTPLPHQKCGDCHKDYHDGIFTKPEFYRDCAHCHTVQGFSGSNYSIEQHRNTKFPLEGSHQAIPCSSCHLKDKTWKFRNIGEQCRDCHKDVHEPYIPEKYYSGKNCKACHSEESWQMVHFDHNLTGFSLEGAHKNLKCMDCHKLKLGETGDSYKNLITLERICVGCHEDIHNRQFDLNGITDCQSCHNYEKWKPSKFEHNTARFKLEGKHAELECKACHTAIVKAGKTFIHYRLNKLECIDCHR